MKLINITLAVLLFSASSCSDKGNQSIIGEWKLIEAMDIPVTKEGGFIRFNKDGSLEQNEITGTDPQYKTSARWTQKGDTICQTATFINMPELPPVESCYTFKLDGSDLILVFDGMTAKYKRK